MQKEVEKGVNFEFIDSLKNNGIKYWLALDDLCQEITNLKAFVEIATARRHPALSILYSKRNLFLQSELGPDVELQKKHIVLFKSIRDMMQIRTISAQPGPGLELVDSYRDATFASYDHSLFFKMFCILERLLRTVIC